MFTLFCRAFPRKNSRESCQSRKGWDLKSPLVAPTLIPKRALKRKLVYIPILLLFIVCLSFRIYTSLYLSSLPYSYTFFLTLGDFHLCLLSFPSCVYRVVLLSQNDPSLPCSYLRKKRGRSFSRRGLTCLTVNSPDFWLACGTTSRTRRR